MLIYFLLVVSLIQPIAISFKKSVSFKIKTIIWIIWAILAAITYFLVDTEYREAVKYFWYIGIPLFAGLFYNKGWLRKDYS